jgi:lysophospholipase L1-like esterase
MKQLDKAVLIIISLVILSNCSYSPTNEQIQLFDEQESNNILSTQLQMIESNLGRKFRIIQFGDSHTAGGMFTNQLAKRLQDKYGNGGVGLIYPISVNGQQIIGVNYSVTGWEAVTSRSKKSDFPLGGIIARSTLAHNKVIINIPNLPQNKLYKFTLWVKPSSNDAKLIFSNESGKIPITSYTIYPETKWKTISFYSSLPLSYQVINGIGYDIGSIQIENGSPGVTVSAMGINGAELNQWQRWNHSIYWQQLKQTNANLIILSYGTNESLDLHLKLTDVQTLWYNTINSIKEALPNAQILIIGAPEGLKALSGGCGIRPINLTNMQNLQSQIATQKHTYYWSWQMAMGGKCSMKNLIINGYARKDGVHFTKVGYELFANKLANDIINANMISIGIQK